MTFDRTQRFKKQYQKLPQHIQRLTNQKLGFLLENFNHPSLKVKKYKGEKGIWEASITKNYRLTFHIEGDTYVLRQVGTHTEILGR